MPRYRTGLIYQKRHPVFNSVCAWPHKEPMWCRSLSYMDIFGEELGLIELSLDLLMLQDKAF